MSKIYSEHDQTTSCVADNAATKSTSKGLIPRAWVYLLGGCLLVLGSACTITSPAVDVGDTKSADTLPIANIHTSSEIDSWNLVHEHGAFREVQFVGKTHGWSVGAGSAEPDAAAVVFHTNDAGQSFHEQYSEAENAIFYDVYFIDSTHGWVTGVANLDVTVLGEVGDGLVLKTSDGGKTWQRKILPAVGYLSAVFFVDKHTGWIAGADGALFKTDNGGNTWNQQTSGTNDYLIDLHFANASRGWALGRRGELLSTVDGGTTWASMDMKEHLGVEESITTTSIHFVDNDRGWIGVNFADAAGVKPGALRTVDGGTTWSRLDGVPAPATPDAMVRNLVAVDSNRVWLVGDFGVMATLDGGDTWQSQELHPALSQFEHVAGVFVSTENSGWLATTSGLFRAQHRP